MFKKTLLLINVLLFALSLKVKPTFAQDFNPQILKLHKVLVKYHSPLQGQEHLLIQTAIRYHLDWPLLAAIAGTESSFATRMPTNCLNPFGWGIYSHHRTCFSSYQEAITRVGEGIGTKYKTTNLTSIARIYNPTHTQKWLRNTLFFLNLIKNTPLSAAELPLTL